MNQMIDNFDLREFDLFFIFDEENTKTTSPEISTFVCLKKLVHI